MRKKIVQLSILLTFLISSVSVVANEVSTDKQTNILWLIAEDMSPDFPMYGVKGLSTPNIDKLAQQGMRFDNVYMTAPICSTARSSFMTGMYQTTIYAHHHRTNNKFRKMLPEGVDVLTNWFHDAGYYTSNLQDLTGKGKQEKFLKGTGKTDWNFKYTPKTKGTGKVTGFDGSDFADLKTNQPFFAQVNFSETHRGSNWKNSYKHIDNPANPEDIELPPYHQDTKIVREQWANYYNSIMALDKKVGYVLDKLEREGLADNTIVIFFSDHGRAMLRGKQFLYEAGLKVPLLVRLPKGYKAPPGFKAGGTSERLLEGIDISATTLQLAGIEIPEKMQGQTFLPATQPEREYVFAARARADETVEYIRSAGNKSFRYIKNYMSERPYAQLNRYVAMQYPELREMHRLKAAGKLNAAQLQFMADSKPEEELYDIIADPHQINNLAYNPEYTKQLKQLRSALGSWEESTQDPQGANPTGDDPQSYLKRAQRNDAKIRALLKSEGMDYDVLLQKEQQHIERLK